MENERTNFKKWLKTHKRELIIAGVSITAILLAYLGYKNRKELLRFWKELESKIKKIPETNIPSNGHKEIFDTSITNSTSDKLMTALPTVVPAPKIVPIHGHTRNLTGGRKASVKKIDEAKKLGIFLTENQTWVSDHTRKIA